ncbi:MAG: hypothetical protein F4Y80_02275 [Caldilineaceae bacterium SB0665_bin_21]|nr:hypothetical protein [Caldilineaceae bacterium SB0665_bin_21]
MGWRPARRVLSFGLCLLVWGTGLTTAAARAPLPDPGGVDPQVCARSIGMRGALLDALTSVGGEMPACEAVTGSQLASLRTLGRSPSETEVAAWDLVGQLTKKQPPFGFEFQALWGFDMVPFGPGDGYRTLGLDAPVRVMSARDLAGLTGLKSLTLRFEGQELPPDLLAPMPRLTRLKLDTAWLTELPSDFLAPVPRLTELILIVPDTSGLLQANGSGRIVLPPDFLAPVPRLTKLILIVPDTSNPYRRWYWRHGSGRIVLPSDFLAPVSHLTHLELHSVNPTTLPSDFLAPVPQLTHLTLSSSGSTSDFLAHVPALTHLEIGSWTETALPSNFLAYVPVLTHLNLHRKESSDSHWFIPMTLPPDFLAPVPRLTHLELRGAEPTALPPDLLAHTPRLTHLIMVPDSVHRPEPGTLPDTLPPGFLTPVPRLTHLELEGWALRGLPPDLLAHTPRLTRLHLRSYGGNLLFLPADFLAPVPQLTHLSLRCVSSSTSVPADFPVDFLVPVPQLTFLDLCVWRQSLPADFLAPVPRLTHLGLFQSGSLPPDFLVPVPRLTHLVGDTPQSPDFAAHVPRLVYLDGYWSGDVPLPSLPSVTHLTLSLDPGLPSGFLAHAPNLTHLRLNAAELRTFPPGFLTHAPRLERLQAFVLDLDELPSGFLAHAPRLTHLYLSDNYFGEAYGDGEEFYNHLTTVPADFLAHAPRLQSVQLPPRPIDRNLLPDPAWSQVRDHGIRSFAIVTARHTAQLSFPGDPQGVRHDILDGTHECENPHLQWWKIRTGADTTVWLSPAETEKVRIHLQAAPRAGMRELQDHTQSELAMMNIVADTSPRPGMMQGQPLYDRPSRKGKVIGYLPWGDALRVTARHGEGVDAWLRGDVMSYMLANPNCRISGWIPATAIWTVADRELHDILGSRRVFHG